MISAVKHNSWVDVATMVGANIGVSMPVFWLGLMLAYVFSLLLKDTPFWLPPSGRLTAGISSVPFYEVFGGGSTRRRDVQAAGVLLQSVYLQRAHHRQLEGARRCDQASNPAFGGAQHDPDGGDRRA